MAVLDLKAVKAALGIELTTHDEQLTGLIAKAEEFVAQRCGPLEPTAVTSRIRPTGCRLLVLPRGPVLSVTSITSRYGTVITSDLYFVDKGIIEADTEFPETYYDVVYQIGRAVDECPTDLVEAALNMCRHLWRPNQGPVGPRQGDQAAAAMAALRLAEELMRPHRRRLVAN